MKNEILYCEYVQPLQMLRLWGRIDEPADEVTLQLGETDLGKATLNVYVHQEPTEFWKNQRNYVFQKVMEVHEENTITIKILTAGSTVCAVQVPLERVWTVPKSLVSTIGTKNGITINDKDQIEAILAKQTECGFKPPLKFLHIESSSKCNLRCRYCIVSNNYDCIERSVITEDVLDKAIEAINQSPELRTVQVSGLGEPLTNPNFCHIIERIEKETNIKKVWFFTNGMLLTPEVSKRIAKSHLNLRIVVSIDGHTPEENNFYRNGSDYRTVRRNLLALLKNVRNRPYFDIQIHNLQVAGETESIQPPRFLLNDFGFLRIDSHRAFYFPELSGEKLEQDGMCAYKDAQKKVCKRMFEQATIRSTGDVVRCHWDSTCSIVMGNVLKTPFYEIWHGEEYVRLRKTMMPDAPFADLPEACQKCHAMNSGYLFKETPAAAQTQAPKTETDGGIMGKIGRFFKK